MNEIALFRQLMSRRVETVYKKVQKSLELVSLAYLRFQNFDLHKTLEERKRFQRTLQEMVAERIASQKELAFEASPEIIEAKEPDELALPGSSPTASFWLPNAILTATISVPHADIQSKSKPLSIPWL